MQHYSDAELLAAADGECSAEQRAEVQSHLEGCWECRARMVALERSIADVMSLQVSAPAQPRRRWVALGVTAASLVAALALYWNWPLGEAASLPRRDLTPGAAKTLQAADVCALPAEEFDRAVPGELARLTFARYGMKEPRSGEYEVDYLISPSLGGASDVRNLWPQPYREGAWNARVKDALEDYLRREVCAGRMELQAAQAAIAEDWIAAYRKFFGAQKPMAAHLLFVKDEPY